RRRRPRFRRRRNRRHPPPPHAAQRIPLAIHANSPRHRKRKTDPRALHHPRSKQQSHLPRHCFQRHPHHAPRRHLHRHRRRQNLPPRRPIHHLRRPRLRIRDRLRNRRSPTWPDHRETFSH